MQKPHLTIPEAVRVSGISRKGIYRTAKRAEAAGHVVRTKINGRAYILREALPVLRQYHYDPKDQSPEAIRRRQEWGVRGGHTPAKRGRPFDRDRFAGITVHDLEIARQYVAEVGGDFEFARALVKLVSRKRGVMPLPPFFLSGTSGTIEPAPPEA